jgi:hypothetical protein
MEKLWVVIARDGIEPVYLKMAKRKSTAKKYLEECKEFFGEECKLEQGEFYTIDEYERLESA